MKPWGYVLLGLGVVGGGLLLWKALAPKGGAHAVAGTGPTSHQTGNQTADTINAVANTTKALSGLAGTLGGLFGGGDDSGGAGDDSGFDAAPQTVA